MSKRAKKLFSFFIPRFFNTISNESKNTINLKKKRYKICDEKMNETKFHDVSCRQIKIISHKKKQDVLNTKNEKKLKKNQLSLRI